MNTKLKVLNVLLNADGYVSGQEIANKLSVTRAAVNKAVNKLRSDGYSVVSVTNKGYMINKNGIIDGERVKSLINGDLKVLTVNETISTNSDAKYLAEQGETAVVIAKRQTGGRGRMNRKFYSPDGGVYFSVIIRPSLSISDGVMITTFCAVAIRRAVLKLSGIDLKIKWVNDLFLNDKKTCGILTEASCDFESGRLKYAVVGVGINVDTVDFPSEIADVATSIYKESKIKIDKNELIAEIINQLLNAEKEINCGSYIEEYKNNCFILGKTVTVYSGNDVYDALAVNVNKNGSLTVEKNGETIVVSSGEVSVKLK